MTGSKGPGEMVPTMFEVAVKPPQHIPENVQKVLFYEWWQIFARISPQRSAVGLSTVFSTFQEVGSNWNCVLCPEWLRFSNKNCDPQTDHSPVY